MIGSDMTRVALAFLVGFSALSVRAAEISESDIGTYYSKLDDGTLRHFVLAKEDGKWAWKDKDTGGAVAKVPCLSGCEYRATTAAENERLFPAQYRQFQDIACIRNANFAFCRLTSKQLPLCSSSSASPCLVKPPPNPERASYLMFALFAARPALIPLWRVEQQ
jgi:hypothetical protein